MRSTPWTETRIKPLGKVGPQAFPYLRERLCKMQNANSVTLLRKPQVLARTGIPKSSWDRGVRQGRYPKPVKIGPRAVAWTSTSIDALIYDLIEKSLETE